jgi:hypothetical protein
MIISEKLMKFEDMDKKPVSILFDVDESEICRLKKSEFRLDSVKKGMKFFLDESWNQNLLDWGRDKEGNPILMHNPVQRDEYTYGGGELEKGVQILYYNELSQCSVVVIPRKYTDYEA